MTRLLDKLIGDALAAKGKAKAGANRLSALLAKAEAAQPFVPKKGKMKARAKTKTKTKAPKTSAPKVSKKSPKAPKVSKKTLKKTPLRAPSSGSPLVGKTVCMTGFRDRAMEEAVVAAGGMVASGVSKHLGFLVAADPDSTSGKASKARAYGVPVIGIDEMNELLRTGRAPSKSTKPVLSREEPVESEKRLSFVAPKATKGDPISGGVLLAEHWDHVSDPTGCWMSDKLDGVRAYWNGEGFYSRNGNLFHAPRFLTEAMPKVALDGEFYLGPGKLFETISIVKEKVPSERRWKQITFQVFDLPDSKEPFEARVAQIKKIVQQLCAHTKLRPCPVQAVEQTRCTSRKHLDDYHRKVVGRGVEGTMLRLAKSLYERRRSRSLLKVVDTHTAEARVVGYEPGEGKHEGILGAYQAVVLTSGVQFKVGGGLTDAQRKRPLKLGSVFTFRYKGLNPSGKPREPSFVAARDYE